MADTQNTAPAGSRIVLRMICHKLWHSHCQLLTLQCSVGPVSTCLQYYTDVLDRLENRYMSGASIVYGSNVCPNAFLNNAAPGEGAGSNPQIVFHQVGMPFGLLYVQHFACMQQ